MGAENKPRNRDRPNISLDISKNLSIVIPNFNEKRIGEVVYWCKKLFPFAEIIVSDDYSGKGKGWAVREGVRKVSKKWVVFIDADMDIHPKEIRKLINDIRSKRDIIVGTKKITEDERGNISSASRSVIKFLFNLPIQDTQTGVKIFPYSLFRNWLWRTNGYLFDVEVLQRGFKEGFNLRQVRIISSKPTKKKGIGVLIKCTYELAALWWRSKYAL